MSWFRRLLRGKSKPKWTVEQEREFIREMTSDSFSDETYRQIYGDDEEAIRAAKESWANAGRQVIEQTFGDRSQYMHDLARSQGDPDPMPGRNYENDPYDP